jgi:hypothetical protein
VIWALAHRAHAGGARIADRHYNRQHPGSPQFVPPGRCLVLVADQALWVTSWPFAEYVKHAWAGAWINSCFRREGGPLASELIRQAVAATRWYWPEIPEINCPYCHESVSMVTFIDAGKVRPKRDPGRCYIRARFRRCKGTTKAGLVVVHIGPSELPGVAEPLGTQLQLLA